MKNRIVIIGGGFAGLWAAFSASRYRELLSKQNQLEIILINKTPYHNIRPRFYECRPDVRIPLKDLLEPIGVTYLIDEVKEICPAKQIIKLLGHESIEFTRCILAAGSQLVDSPIKGLREFSYNVDTYESSQSLLTALKARHQAHPFSKYDNIVVVGGGFTGIEMISELPKILHEFQIEKQQMPNLVLVDRHEIGHQFHPDMQRIVQQALSELSICCVEQVTIEKVTTDKIYLSNNKTVSYAMLINTLGMQASGLTQCIDDQRDSVGRVQVLETLQSPSNLNIFVAGDVASVLIDNTHRSLMSCQHARPQGMVAGHNAVASLFNQPLLSYSQPHYVTCLDLGDWGAIYSEGWNHVVTSIGATAKVIKQEINCKRIYPPTVLTKQNIYAASVPKDGSL